MSCRVLAVGEVVWDVIHGQEYIGGAPFNLAAHVARLGGDACLLTRVGHDARGDRALRAIRRIGIDAAFVQRDHHQPTGWARVTFSRDGSPTFTLPRNPAYRHIAMDDSIHRRMAAGPFDAIAFGTLQQAGTATRRTLRALLKTLPAREVLYDVNIRMNYYPRDVLRQSLQHSTIVKLNEEEVSRVSRRLYGASLPESRFAKKLLREFPLRVLCVTKGAQGCTVHTAGESRTIAGVPVKVADTVGAGDAFSAAFLTHYVRTQDPFEAAYLGNRLGAYVASRPGAVPKYDLGIKRALAGRAPGSRSDPERQLPTRPASP